MEEKDGISGSVSLDNSTNVFTNRYLLNNGWGSVANFPFSAITQCVNQSIRVPQYLVTDPSITEIPQCLVTTDAGKTFQFGAFAYYGNAWLRCAKGIIPGIRGFSSHSSISYCRDDCRTIFTGVCQKQTKYHCFV